MKEHQTEILYSEPVKEIMGHPPSRILRWGTTIIFSVFVLLIIFSWVIKYPDTVPAPVEITTSNPPVMLLSKITGRIKELYVREGQKVTAGTCVAAMETTASLDDIRLLRQITDTITRPEFLNVKTFPGLSKLGEIQSSYAVFLKYLSDLNNYNLNDLYGHRIKSMTSEINGIKEYLNRLSVKEKLHTENQNLEFNQYSRDTFLFNQNLLTREEIEKSRQSLIRNNIELQQVRLDHSAKSIELAQKNQLLQDYRITRNEERETLVTSLNEAFLNLKAQMQFWENNYLLISPVEGIVTFTKYWSANQSVLKDVPVISIVPLDKGEYIGRINLRMQRSGKVKVGQKVNIKLSSFPYLEYGMVRGVVKSKSLVTSEDAYIIEVELINGLSTTYGKSLPEPAQNMMGTAEIKTDNIRLFQKIINPFRHLITKNKE